MIYFYFIQKDHYATFCNDGTNYHFRFLSDEVVMPDLGSKKYYEDFDFYLQSAREVNFEIPINRDDRHIDDYTDFFLEKIENFEDTELSKYVVVIKDTEKPKPFFAGILDYKVQYKDDVMSFTAYDFSILFNKYGDAEFDFSDPIYGVCTADGLVNTISFTDNDTESGNLLSDYKIDEIVVLFDEVTAVAYYVTIKEIVDSNFSFLGLSLGLNRNYQMKKTTKFRKNEMFDPKLTEWKVTRNWLTNVVEEMSLWYFENGTIQAMAEYEEKLDIERSEALILERNKYISEDGFDVLTTAFCYEKNQQSYFVVKTAIEYGYDEQHGYYTSYSWIDIYEAFEVSSVGVISDVPTYAKQVYRFNANLQSLIEADGFVWDGATQISDRNNNLLRTNITSTKVQFFFKLSPFLTYIDYDKKFHTVTDILKFLLFANNLTAYTDYNTIYFNNKQENTGDYEIIDLDYATDTSPSIFVIDKYSADAFGVLPDGESKDKISSAIVNYYNDFIYKTKFEFEFGYLDNDNIIDVGKVVFDGSKYIFITEIEENLDDNFKNIRGFNVDLSNFNTRFNYKLNFILGG